MKKLNPGFWKGRRVLLTGHTGFKGAWTALLLERLGASVLGIALSPSTDPNLYEILSPWSNLEHIQCDIRQQRLLAEIVSSHNPEIVMHMAAQPLVRESYYDPVSTIETNVMGTVYLLESLRAATNLLGILVITSDKVYEASGHGIALSESSPLGGHDPYSASKAATEILTATYAKSFFSERGVPVCTARAGNVVGGGDWSKDRIIPDLWQAYCNKQPVEIRYPEAVRPWQHVLDPVYGYLLYLENMIDSTNETPRALNFGPPIEPLCNVLNLANRFANILETPPFWTIGKSDIQLIENKFLSIDASLAKSKLGWHSLLDVDDTVLWTCQWYKAFRDGKNMREFSNAQLDSYFDLILTPSYA